MLKGFMIYIAGFWVLSTGTNNLIYDIDTMSHVSDDIYVVSMFVVLVIHLILNYAIYAFSVSFIPK